MVPTATENGNSTSIFVTKRKSHSPKPINQKTPPDGKTTTVCFQDIRTELCSRGIPEAAADIILASWRSTTKKQYGTYLSQWLSFCSEQQIPPFSPSVNMLIQFLTTLYDQGLQYRAINTAKSAISSVINFLSNKQLGNHILIKQFMKGVSENRPALPKYNCTWDAALVLKFFSLHKLVNQLSIQELGTRLATLLALTTGQRTQTLFFMDLKNIVLTDTDVKIRIGDPLKQSKVNCHLGEIYIEAYPDEKLCVVKTLKEYVQRTEQKREDTTKVFISSKKPFKPVSSCTIAKWIKSVLGKAGIDMSVFTAHSTRGASTSALTNRVPIDTILRTAGWKRDCVFRKFYKRDITNNSDFSNGILKLNQGKA
ncbi:uncharacterized protein LOC123524443 [Mercenaria mercenaria]|uniref:uncharacterized protein LOC123524443 n=1 Tax=Mercenaria mercenaria TaxID=6596 RepID=UPI00234EC84D|nr:uncharacterized protein LOC123524443 [Mercenaria mercenaria]